MCKETIGELEYRGHRIWININAAGQYSVDLAADRLVLDALANTDLSVLSEESAPSRHRARVGGRATVSPALADKNARGSAAVCRLNRHG